MSKEKPAQVFHFSLQGKRDFKYDFLNENSLSTIDWQELKPTEPNFFFVPKNFDEIAEYEKGFKVDELFLNNYSGIESAKDSLVYSESFKNLDNIIFDFKNKEIDELSKFYNFNNEKLKQVKNDISNSIIIKASYKIFQDKFIIWSKNSQGVLWRPRTEGVRNYFKENIGVVLMRSQVDIENFQTIFISKYPTDKNFYGFQTYFFPLYLYLEKNAQQSIETTPNPSKGGELERVPNLNTEIVNKIAEGLGLPFVAEKKAPPQSKEQNRSTIPKAPLLCKEGLGVVVKQKINNLPHLKTFRRELRKNLTPAEATLWKMLQGKKLEGRKFRRQHSVDNYILDFYCPSERIAIELDGEGHFEENQSEYDKERDLFLNHYGIRVLRYENKWVWDNPEGLLENIRSYFGTTPAPPYKGGEPSGSDLSLEEGELSDTALSLEEGELMGFAPIDILDYIYAVLHSPSYREKYKEFLKIDFPRVPCPKDKETFLQLVQLGSEIRQIHLLESPVVENYITQYPIDGDNVVVKPKFINSPPEKEGCPQDGVVGKVYINDTQYFDNVPQVAWEFYIGGYQPAQKWLKDRKDRKLEFEDILHYQKIIVALSETDRLMREIDKIGVK